MDFLLDFSNDVYRGTADHRVVWTLAHGSIKSILEYSKYFIVTIIDQ